MKILISDYKDVLDRDIEYEKKLLFEAFPEAEIEVYPYESQEAFIQKMKTVNVLSTAFLPVTREVIEAAKELKCISINATGYGNVDVAAVEENEITLCTVKEYCTQEVAEHTMALMLALVRNLKHYSREIDQKQRWQYQSVTKMLRLSGQTLAIFGFGRIGQAVAKRAKAFEMNVIAVDPYISIEKAEEMGVSIVSQEYALEHADIITNHMNQTRENKAYFNKEVFYKMKKTPIFINVGRGECVAEEALVEALDDGIIRAAGLDVLKEENPILKNHPLCNRENVILTPHAAFYSEDSMRKLQRVTCENIIETLKRSKIRKEG